MGSKGAALKQHIDATLGSGNLREAVLLPPGEDLNEWLAVNTVDFYNAISVLYATLGRERHRGKLDPFSRVARIPFLRTMRRLFRHCCVGDVPIIKSYPVCTRDAPGTLDFTWMSKECLKLVQVNGSDPAIWRVLHGQGMSNDVRGPQVRIQVGGRCESEEADRVHSA